MSFKNPKDMYPSFAFVIENAELCEHCREATRRAPIYYPAPPLIWVKGNGRELPRIIIGVSETTPSLPNAGI